MAKSGIKLLLVFVFTSKWLNKSFKTEFSFAILSIKQCHILSYLAIDFFFFLGGGGVAVNGKARYKIAVIIVFYFLGVSLSI